MCLQMQLDNAEDIKKYESKNTVAICVVCVSLSVKQNHPVK